jgi:hypothetical protein
MPSRRSAPRRPSTRPTDAAIGTVYEDEEPSRLAALAPYLAIGGVILAAVALVVAVTGRAPDVTACRTAAWSAVPAAGSLPSGWTITSTDLNANGITTSIVGPTADDGSGNQPVVYASVTCYGDGAATALARSRDAADTAGAKTSNRDGLGDEAYTTDDSATGTSSTFIRVGGLVSQIAAAGTIASADLDRITAAVLASMGSRSIAAGSTSRAGSSVPAGSGLDASASPSEGASGGPSASPSASISVAAELEAHFPTKVNDTTLTIQSLTGSDILGTDPNSRALTAAVRTLGKEPTDLQVVQAWDDTQATDLFMFGFRLEGIDGARLEAVILDTWLSADAAGVKKTQIKVGDKTLTRVDFGDEGTIDYVYTGSDYVLVIDTADDALATAAAAGIR